MAKKPTNPWLNKSWKLMAAQGPSTPLMVKRKKPRKGDNEFRLVVGSRTGSRINYYKVNFKNGAMTTHWRNCVLVPRGTDALVLKDQEGQPIPPLTANPTDNEIETIAMQLVTAIDRKGRINTSRLECDLTLPEFAQDEATNTFGSTGGQAFGQLRLFQVPKALGPRTLLVTDFAIQGTEPGGSGGGGSVIA